MKLAYYYTEIAHAVLNDIQAVHEIICQEQGSY